MDKKFLDLGWTSMQVLKREQLSILRVYCARFRINSTFLHNLFLRFVGIVVNVIHFNAFESAKTSGHSLTSKTEKNKWKKKNRKGNAKRRISRFHLLYSALYFEAGVYYVRNPGRPKRCFWFADVSSINLHYVFKNTRRLIATTFSKSCEDTGVFLLFTGGRVGRSLLVLWTRLIGRREESDANESETKASEKRRNKNEIEPPLTIGESDRLAAGPQSGLRRSRASGFLRAFGSKKLVRGLRFESAPAIKE